RTPLPTAVASSTSNAKNIITHAYPPYFFPYLLKLNVSKFHIILNLGFSIYKIDREKGPLVFPYLSRDSQGLLELCNIAKYVSGFELKPNNRLLLMHCTVHPATSAYEFADPSLPSASSSFTLITRKGQEN
ncbi:MAG: hypothetical protein WAM14_12865, partial [Candidatus Nitrosopolaris sp.]